MSSTTETSLTSSQFRSEVWLGRNAKQRWNFKRNWVLYLFLLPAFTLVIIFNYVPILGLVMVFQDFNAFKGFTGSRFIGLENFRIMWDTPGILQIVWNTFIIASAKIVCGLIVPFVFALLLNEVRISLIKRFVQTLVYLPHFLSWVILAGILIDMLNFQGGIINRMLNFIGVPSIFFLGDGDWFRVTVIVSATWKEFGFSAIIILAAIASIDPTLYEAAYIDGANRWKQTLYITVPSLMPVMIVIATLSLGNILNADFDQIFNLYNGLVYDKGDIIDTYVYRMGMLNANYSFAAGVGMLKSLISFFLIVLSYWLAVKLANYRIF